MKIEIVVTRNDLEITDGHSEESLVQYLERYVKTYGVAARLERDFPEFNCTDARLVRDDTS